MIKPTGRNGAIILLSAALSACAGAPSRPTVDFDLKDLDIVVADPKTGTALCVFPNKENERSGVRQATNFNRLQDCDTKILDRYWFQEIDRHIYMDADTPAKTPLLPVRTETPIATEAAPLGPVTPQLS